MNNEINSTQLYLLTYAYDDVCDEKNVPLTNAISKYVLETFGSFKCSCSKKDSQPGIIVVWIVDGIGTLSFGETKYLTKGIPDNCKTGGLTIILTYKHRPDKETKSWKQCY